MSDRATIRQVVQIGPEVTRGTVIAATKRLQGMMLNITPNITATDVFGSGMKYASTVAVEEEWTAGKITGTAVLYDELQFLLCSLFGKPTPVQNGSGLGYTWSFEPNTSAEDVPQTYSFEYGETAQAEGFGYGLITDTTLTWDRKNVKMAGSLIGQRLTEGITMTPQVGDTWTLTVTGTPTGGTFTLTVAGQTTAAIAYNATPAAVQAALVALSAIGNNVTCTGTALPGGSVAIAFSGDLAGISETVTHTDSFTGGTSPAAALAHTVSASGPVTVPVVPVLANQIDVFMDTTAAGLGTTKLTRDYIAEFTIGGKFKPIWVLNSANTSFAAHVEAQPKTTLKLLVEADTTGMGILADMRLGNTKFFRVQATGAQIDASPAFNYSLKADFAAQVSAIAELKDQEGTLGVEYTFTVKQDDTWGRALQFSLGNRQSGL